MPFDSYIHSYMINMYEKKLRKKNNKIEIKNTRHPPICGFIALF